jgi:L-rhamnose mutarotase
MERAFFTLKLKSGYEDEYDRAHQDVWPSVLDALAECGITAFSIFRDGANLYFYMEAPDFRASMDILNANAEHTRWNQDHSHFFVSAVGPTSGDAGFALVPEVFRFEGAGRTGGG